MRRNAQPRRIFSEMRSQMKPELSSSIPWSAERRPVEVSCRPMKTKERTKCRTI